MREAGKDPSGCHSCSARDSGAAWGIPLCWAELSSAAPSGGAGAHARHVQRGRFSPGLYPLQVSAPARAPRDRADAGAVRASHRPAIASFADPTAPTSNGHSLLELPASPPPRNPSFPPPTPPTPRDEILSPAPPPRWSRCLGRAPRAQRLQAHTPPAAPAVRAPASPGPCCPVTYSKVVVEGKRPPVGKRKLGERAAAASRGADGTRRHPAASRGSETLSARPLSAPVESRTDDLGSRDYLPGERSQRSRALLLVAKLLQFSRGTRTLRACVFASVCAHRVCVCRPHATGLWVSAPQPARRVRDRKRPFSKRVRRALPAR